mgnify:CR=1 FL=1|tara:strand:+ start:729 stop:1529 length:801 start_codon:yes stop_codon:yes gene_type:complete
MSDIFKILIASNNDEEAIGIANKVKKHFDMPLEVHTAHDGDRALYLFAQNTPQIIFVTIDLPVLSGKDVIRAIREKDGGVAIYVLGRKGEELDFPGIEILETPIQNWTAFFDLVIQEIPQNMKARHGLVRRDEKLIEMLESWVRDELKITPKKDKSAETPAQVLIPNYFYSSAPKASREERNNEDEKLTITTANTPSETGLSSISSRPIWDISILLVLVGLTITTYFFDPTKESNAIGLSQIIGAITVMAFFGYFLGKAVGVVKEK